LAYRLCDREGNCQDNYPDADFNKYFLKDTSIGLSGPFIIKGGKVIGTFERTSADDMSPSANEFVRQMSAQREATKAFIGDLILRSVVGGVLNGGLSIALGTSGPSVASRGLSRAATPVARGLAEQVAAQTGGKLVQIGSKGYKVIIPRGGREIVVRIMQEGGGRTNYWRVSIAGKQAFTAEGIASTDRALTHIPIGRGSLDQILNVLRRIGQ